MLNKWKSRRGNKQFYSSELPQLLLWEIDKQGHIDMDNLIFVRCRGSENGHWGQIRKEPPDKAGKRV
jgi:hypothetical protein